MFEGSILHVFADAPANKAFSTEQLAERAKLKQSVVIEVCTKSNKIEPYQYRSDIWQLVYRAPV